MMNHRLTAGILLTLLAAPCLWATTAAANAPAHPAGYNDSGVELNRTRQYLERQRIARKSRKGGIPNRWKGRKVRKKHRRVPSTSC